VNNYENIGDTNLTTGVFYYIKEKSGKYLRWDGNIDLFGGLYFDPELRDDYKKDWYLFSLVNSDRNKTTIRNLKLERYLCYFGGFIGLFSYVFIRSETEFDVIEENNENWLKIQYSRNKSYITSNI
jgi:hypothetical protein